GQGVPLIVTSAVHKDTQTLQRLHHEVGAQFFAKPFQVRELMAAVRKTLDRAEQGVRKDPTGPVRVQEPTPIQTGRVAERPPARLLLDLFDQRATGTLTVVRGKVKKEIALLH